MKRKGGAFFVGKYASSKAKKWGDELARALSPIRPNKPIEGPLKARIGWVFPHLKSTPKSKLDLNIWKVTRPDLDNMEKTILDTMTKQGFMLDDSQVVLKETFKMNGPDVGMFIELSTLDNDADLCKVISSTQNKHETPQSKTVRDSNSCP